MRKRYRTQADGRDWWSSLLPEAIAIQTACRLSLLQRGGAMACRAFFLRNHLWPGGGRLEIGIMLMPVNLLSCMPTDAPHSA